ncbi:unnamed protein product [Anisakis simplex]|uniref:Deterin (inferred by orthology to a D. melanogaster protein) n=1 Tax=Anisakis simplex TaxID=6269 RepID=A0A0M3JVZ1_ANISI|nr:unnamed protein product [Anisakis simplex]
MVGHQRKIVATSNSVRTAITDTSDFRVKGDGGCITPLISKRFTTQNQESLKAELFSFIVQSYSPYFFYANRLKSFTSRWPHRIDNLSPQKFDSCLQMAEAGFFYCPGRTKQDADNVKCPFCLKELTHWEPTDNPIVEHRKRQNGCYFMQLNAKERDFTMHDFLLLISQRHASRLVS